MKLLYTTNQSFEHYEDKECSIDFRGFVMLIMFENNKVIKTGEVQKIKRKNNILKVTTKNSIYEIQLN